MRITGIKSLEQKLKRLGVRGKKVEYLVGYTQNYAVFVHENLQAHHTNGQAKYLEQPARQLGPELGKIAGQVMTKTNNLDTAIKLPALRLQRESQKLVPVDTSALKNSAFTRKVK